MVSWTSLRIAVFPRFDNRIELRINARSDAQNNVSIAAVATTGRVPGDPPEPSDFLSGEGGNEKKICMFCPAEPRRGNGVSEAC
jgi:hypothetical protein